MKLIRETLSLPARYTVNADATKARDALVADARRITAVESVADQDLAATIGSTLQREIKAVVAARKELAEPLNQAAKRLIALEDEHNAPLLAEKDRLGKLVGAFKKAEDERVENEKRQRREAIERLENERKAALAVSESFKGQLDEVADVQAQQRAFEAQEAAMELMRKPDPAPVKAKGSVTKKTLGWRVLDIHALYAARPDLCKVEPKPSAILATCDPAREIPGLELWWENTTNFRSA
jgi:hypothetical protein